MCFLASYRERTYWRCLRNAQYHACKLSRHATPPSLDRAVDPFRTQASSTRLQRALQHGSGIYCAKVHVKRQTHDARGQPPAIQFALIIDSRPLNNSQRAPADNVYAHSKTASNYAGCAWRQRPRRLSYYRYKTEKKREWVAERASIGRGVHNGCGVAAVCSRDRRLMRTDAAWPTPSLPRPSA